MKSKIQIAGIVFLLLLVLSIILLSLNYHNNRLSSLRVEYEELQNKVLALASQQQLLSLEQWILNELGSSPLNISAQDLTNKTETIVFYDPEPVRQTLTSKLDPIGQSFNITVQYLPLWDPENLELQEEIVNRTGSTASSQNLMVFLSASRIIMVNPYQVNHEAFEKCLEYLILSMLLT